jgi:hypothetical protein
MTDLEIFEKFTSLFIDLDDFHYLLTNKPLLAHYTSIQVLEQIMRNDEMWFSNPLFMNDLQEMRYGIHQGIIQFDQLSSTFRNSRRSAASLHRWFCDRAGISRCPTITGTSNKSVGVILGAGPK